MNYKKMMALGLSAALCMSMLAACGGNGGSSNGGEEQVVIYSNADEEAVTAMQNALDNNGYKGKYIFQTYGTSELGGKLLAEGTNLEADLVTMSTFYLQSAQEQNNMFLPLTFEVNTLTEVPDYTAPITSQEGAIILNTELMASEGLPTPTSLKDLADPVYAGQVAVTDIQSSSTAWLLIQALVDAYGDDGAQEVLSGIYDNCGAHIETSGSGPLKLCRAGEVAIGFGLRHQAVADKADGNSAYGYGGQGGYGGSSGSREQGTWYGQAYGESSDEFFDPFGWNGRQGRAPVFRKSALLYILAAFLLLNLLSSFLTRSAYSQAQEQLGWQMEQFEQYQQMFPDEFPNQQTRPDEDRTQENDTAQDGAMGERPFMPFQGTENLP